MVGWVGLVACAWRCQRPRQAGAGAQHGAGSVAACERLAIPAREPRKAADLCAPQQGLGTPALPVPPEPLGGAPTSGGGAGAGGGDALHAAVAVAERALLYALSFELNVEHAYKPVYDMLAHYRLKNGPPHHPATNHSMLPQTAWNLLEDRRAPGV